MSHTAAREGTWMEVELFDPDLYSLICESKEKCRLGALGEPLEPFDAEIKARWLVRPN